MSILRCAACGGEQRLGPQFYGCSTCGGRLDVHLSQEELHSCWEAHTSASTSGSIVASVFPGIPPATVLNEGRTPLVAAPFDGLAEAHVKQEGTNPTGSFKDRQNAVSVSVLRQLGCDRIAASSTGNQALSLATYCAASGLRARVLLPYEAPLRFATEVRSLGAEAHVMPWELRSAAMAALVAEGWGYSGRNWPRPVASPYGIEGYRSIAYEIFSQLGDRVPTHVFMPTCGGDGIAGVAKGFGDLVRLGLTSDTPVLVGCQSLRSASVLNAFEAGSEVPEPVPLQWSVALSLVDQQGGPHGLAAVRESGGWIEGLSEDELLAGVADLARRGIAADPAGAAGWSALRRWVAAREPGAHRGGGVPTDMVGVAIVTASSGRWPASDLASEAQHPRVVDKAASRRRRGARA